MALLRARPAPSWLLAFLVAVLAIGTALPSLQTGSTATNQQCSSLLDVILVFDESGSVGSSNYKKVRQFGSDFYNSMPVSPTDLHVGVITYSTSVRPKWGLKDPRAQDPKLGASSVLGLPYAGGNTNTAGALTEAAKMFAEGGRDGAPKMLMLMTDGASNSSSKTIAAAQQLRNSGVIVVTLGVGSGVRTSECRSVVGCSNSGTCEKFIQTNWSNVNQQVTNIMKAACKDLPVDAVCSPWSEYGPCEGKCGTTGTQKSTRVETAPPKAGTPPCPTCPAPMGRSCKDQSPGLVRTRTCTLPVCKVDAGCGEFGAWSEWSASCGSATRTRVRGEFNNPPAAGGGLSCEQQQPPKHQREVETVTKAPCPVNQKPGPWSEWSECTATCGGGKRTRHREGTPQVGELYGGQNLKEQGIPTEETQDCNTYPCPVNATCGEWTDYSNCSKSCGGGSQSRHREPWLKNAQHGGLTCEEQHPEGKTDTRPCNTQPCPVDEVPGDWGPWGKCSAECGPGEQRRDRMESPVKANYGGKTIEEQNEHLPDDKKVQRTEVRACENNPCGPCVLPFTEWSPCTCGGTRSRQRMVGFDYYDKPCEEETTESEPCGPEYCSTPSTGPSDGAGGDGDGEGEDRDEANTVPAAAIAGGVVGGLVLLGAAGGGAAYAMGGTAGQAAQVAENVLESEEAAQNLVEEERESMISAGDQTEMWAA